MIASARVLPYDCAVLGDGLVPVASAAEVTVPTPVLAARDDPATAQALVDALPRGESTPTRVSLHELGPSEIAALVAAFLARR